MKLLFLTLVLMLCGILPALAQNIKTDRPDQTESSATIKSGNFQIESGILLGYTSERSIVQRQILAPSTLLRYGLFSKAELRIVNQYEIYESLGNTRQGIGDLQIGTKIQLFQKEAAMTEVAFLSHVVLPTGTSAVTSGDYGSINKLAVSHSLGGNVGLGYNIGYNYFTDNGDLTYTIALSTAVNNKVGIYIEPYGSYLNMTDWETNFDAGFTYLVNPDFQLDFSLGVGLDHDMNYISVGFSWVAHKDNP